MSRIGKNAITIPEKVEVTITETPIAQIVKVKGPKGELQSSFKKEIKFLRKDNTLLLERTNEEKPTKCLHGTYRTLIHNMILGVTQGFKKELDIVGVGYRAQLQGEKLVLQIGYSHQVEVSPPSKETKIEIDKSQTHITVTGISKQVVGDLAAYIREVRSPEPYKGKGIKYSDEKIRRKVGKSAAKK